MLFARALKRGKKRSDRVLFESPFTYRLDDIGGHSIEFPEVKGRPCRGGFAFGIYKGGSSLLATAVRRLAKQTHTKYFNLTQACLLGGVLLEEAVFSDYSRCMLEEWLGKPGVLLAGWRQFPSNFSIPLGRDTRTYLLVRDPRDAITSLYFSLKYSHSTTGALAAPILRSRDRLQDMDIDGFALALAPLFAAKFQAYRPLERTNLLLHRYEDIIFDKEKFLAAISAHFGIDASPAVLAGVAQSVDERPATEDINAHVRQVTPGDHKRKLKPATIEALNQILSDVLLKYDYDVA
jgi:hypothetical protein